MGTSKTFKEGISELRSLVGSGAVVAAIAVDQVYAHYQDGGGDEPSHGPRGKPGVDFNHPRGGHALYLSGQIKTRRVEVMEAWTRSILRTSNVTTTITLATSFADRVYIDAPIEYWVLRNSASVKVTEDGATRFLRPALIPRLTQTELNAIRTAAGGDVTHGLTGDRQHTTTHSSLGFTTSTTLRSIHGSRP